MNAESLSEGPTGGRNSRDASAFALVFRIRFLKFEDALAGATSSQSVFDKGGGPRSEGSSRLSKPDRGSSLPERDSYRIR